MRTGDHSIVSVSFERSLFGPATPARVEILPVLVANLSPMSTSTILSAFDESRIPIGPNDPVVQTSPVHVSHRLFCVCARVVFDEAEAARGLLEPVQSHDDPFHVARAREQLVNLLLAAVVGQVADVQRGTGQQRILLISQRTSRTLLLFNSKRTEVLRLPALVRSESLVAIGAQGNAVRVILHF